MIVQCDRCRTKFRIADERVSEKGVKVRCSRCAHVFVVRRPEELRFTADGPDTTRLDPSALMSLAAQTQPQAPEPPTAPPGFPPPGVPASGPSPDEEAITEQAALPGPKPPALPSWAQEQTVARDDPPPLPRVEAEPVRFPAPSTPPPAPVDRFFADEPGFGPIGDAAPASNPFGAPMEADAGDIPGLLPPEAIGDGDPFGGDDASEPSAGGFEPDPDFADPPAPPAANGAAPIARIDLGQAGVPNLSERWGQAETTAIAAAYEGSARPASMRRELPQVGDRGGLWPSIVGALVGLLFVVTLMPDVGRGILDRVSRRSGDALTRVSRQRVLPESLDTLRALGTRVTAYRIGSGERVLVVRGVARNLGSDPAAGLSAVALAMDGDRVVARASAPVGVMLEPEVLADLSNPDEVAGAYARRSAKADLTRLAPGDEAPFMVVFPELPPNVGDTNFLVEFVPFDAPEPPPR